MSDFAIQIENLSKLYKIPYVQQRRYTLRDELADGVKRLFRRSDRTNSGSHRIWALKGVSLEIGQGEVVGIIGANGAGKSTLLKILSRIAEPTDGRAQIRGRIGALLEVGTGFHPELTGRENIYLNGAILGMRRQEINQKLDEIVAFAEVGEFLDTPLKHYSSGMHVRLAFAVAAHLQTEVLLVDEVLAVGDVRFQRKCFGKVSEIAGSGRTVLFVSHNMTAILNLCSRAVYLESGRLIHDGNVADVVDRYLTVFDEQENLFLPRSDSDRGDPQARIVGVEVRPKPPRTGEPVEFVITVSRQDSAMHDLKADLAISILTREGVRLTTLYSQHMGVELAIPPGTVQIVARLDSLPLAPGRYLVSVWLGTDTTSIHSLRDCFLLAVGPGRVGDGMVVASWVSPILVPSNWHVLRLPMSGRIVVPARGQD